MSDLFYEGFELGTSLTEANTMSGNTISLNANVNPASTFTFGAASSGQGRSLVMSVLPNFTAQANQPVVSSNVSGFLGASGAIGYKFSMGFRAKLNANKTSAVGCSVGLKAPAANSSYALLSIASALTTLPQTITAQFGTGSIGTFNSVSDYNMHYYTITATKTAANVWSVQIYVDKIQQLSVTGVSAAMADAVIMAYAWTDGGTTTVPTNTFSELDDMYISDTSPKGIINIRRLQGSADVQAQFTKVGGAASNWASVDNISLSGATSLTAAAAAEDIYANAATLTPGYKLLAVNATAMCTGVSGDTITAKASAGANTIASSATPLSALDTRVSTGWQFLSASALNAIQFGQAKA